MPEVTFQAKLVWTLGRHSTTTLTTDFINFASCVTLHGSTLAVFGFLYRRMLHCQWYGLVVCGKVERPMGIISFCHLCSTSSKIQFGIANRLQEVQIEPCTLRSVFEVPVYSFAEYTLLYWERRPYQTLFLLCLFFISWKWIVWSNIQLSTF